MPATDRSNLIDAYDRGAELANDAIRGLGVEELRRVPPADAGPEVGKWSIQQVIVHLADAELAFADRIKRIAAEDDPVLQAWDENRFVERLAYDKQSASYAAILVALTRKQVTAILRSLPDAAFARTGRHSQRGLQTIVDVLGYAVPHLERHLTFVHAKRKLMGRPAA
jgi:uncharacterized damage-inducible protein DinB